MALMTDRDPMAQIVPPRTRSQVLLDQYVIALSIVTLIFGLRYWAVILGAMPGGGGSFDQMSVGWSAVTIHMAVVDPVASVGLWLRVAGGKVLWIYSALFEIALHTAFINTFGTNFPLVVFHVFTLALFVVLTIVATRSRARR
jgi:hypothetical protein